MNQRLEELITEIQVTR